MGVGTNVNIKISANDTIDMGQVDFDGDAVADYLIMTNTINLGSDDPQLYAQTIKYVRFDFTSPVDYPTNLTITTNHDYNGGYLLNE
jgi:hypothetical protein